MIHEFGVRAGRISLNRMVELLSTNPAKLFGLYPRKGRSRSGPTRTSSSSTRADGHDLGATHHSKSDYNLFEGTEVTGVPEVVLLRGRCLVENGELVASPESASSSRARSSAKSSSPRRCRHDRLGRRHRAGDDRERDVPHRSSGPATTPQLTVMSIPAGEDIGKEVHPDHDQFLRIEQGSGRVEMGPSEDEVDFTQDVGADWAIVVPCRRLAQRGQHRRRAS
jgi:mannose-6-phosphate isomerase-like protein (cupin superfamily)